MKLTRIIIFGVAAAVFASLSCRAAVVSDFAHTHLKLDLAAYPFGSAPERYSEYEKVAQGDVMYLYGKSVPDRDTIPSHHIILKFVKEKLVEVTISFSGKEQNDELVRQFTRMSGIDPQKER